MDVSEKWGTDVDTAVNLALAELRATKEEVDITVLEQPSRGFFGIGSKLALVRVERKKEEPEKEAFEEEICPNNNEDIKSEEIKTEPSEKKEAKKAELKTEEKISCKKEKKRTEESEKPEEEIKIFENNSKLKDLEDHEATDFLKDTIEKMGLEISIESKTDGKNIFIYMEGKDAGTIIGKRGQTLDSLQYLTSLVVNKGGGDYKRIILDAENYREKREKTLRRLATRLAGKVAKTGRDVKLEPMNPYERKVIHSTLQSDNRVKTRSEGQDPYRRVVIEHK